FAQLHVRTEAAGAQTDLFFRTWIDTQLDRAGIAFTRLGADLAGEFAFRIVGAADKGAEAAQLQVQVAIFAGRAFARVDTRLAIRKGVRRKNLVQLVDDVADLEILGLAHRGREVLPEIAQQLLPVQLAVGDFVQLLFQVGREVIGDIAVEEAVEEGGDQPALVFWDK